MSNILTILSDIKIYTSDSHTILKTDIYNSTDKETYNKLVKFIDMNNNSIQKYLEELYQINMNKILLPLHSHLPPISEYIPEPSAPNECDVNKAKLYIPDYNPPQINTNKIQYTQYIEISPKKKDKKCIIS
jgi:hypothetical protein